MFKAAVLENENFQGVSIVISFGSMTHVVTFEIRNSF